MKIHTDHFFTKWNFTLVNIMSIHYNFLLDNVLEIFHFCSYGCNLDHGLWLTGGWRGTAKSLRNQQKLPSQLSIKKSVWHFDFEVPLALWFEVEKSQIEMLAM